MKNIFSKPLFWSNVAAFLVTGLVVAGVALAWNSPTAVPSGGSGAISTDGSNNVGIGTAAVAGSRLRVSGLIESLSGGIKFPDGTIQSSASAPHGKQFYSSSGSFLVPAGVSTLYLTGCAGGGGASGGSSSKGGTSEGPGGGGGACVLSQIISVTPSVSYPVVIGAGGAGVTTAPAVAGGVTSFGTLLSLSGGGGGGVVTAGTGGASGGGTSSAGQNSSSGCTVGGGGDTIFGVGGKTIPVILAIGSNGAGYGSGGGGGCGAALGGNGQPGFFIIEW